MKHYLKQWKPWSKLQKQIYNFIDEKINFQIHCVAHRMRWASSTTPTRYWITLEKEILWDYPKDFVEKYTETIRCRDGSLQEFNKSRLINVEGEEAEWYPYVTQISEISNLIREYIDTPKNEIFEKHFENDKWGLTNILKAADRRIGKERLHVLKIKSESVAINKIIAKRLSDKQDNLHPER